MCRKLFCLFVVVIALYSLCVLSSSANAGSHANIVFPADTPQPGNSFPEYTELRKISLSGETASTNNLVLKRDAGTFTFRSGTLYFLAPVKGKVTGAVFIGDGTFSLTPPLPSEKKSLSFLTKEESINEEFNQLVLRFTDATYDEIKKQVTIGKGATDGQPASILKDNQTTLRLTINYNLAGRILEDVLMDKPGGLFYAFIKGKKYNGKLIYSIDPQGNLFVAPEEVMLWTYDDNKSGLWCAFHSSDEYASGKASGDELNAPIDIERQKLDVEIERSGKLNGTAITTFASRIDGLRAAEFKLFRTLRVSKVTDSNGNALPFIQEDKAADPQYFVVLPKPLSKGERFAITTVYSGPEAILSEGRGNYYPVARDDWYPNSKFGDYAEYEMTFRIPKNMTMVATGTPVSDAIEGDANISVWRTEVPQAVAGFNFGLFKKKESVDEKLGYTFDSFANTELPDSREAQGYDRAATTNVMNQVHAESELSISIYTDFFGPCPYKRIAMTQQTATNYGQSWPGLVFMPLDSFLRAHGSKGFFHVVAPHEVAHQWWGHMVGFNSYRDQWMSEGFAEFSASLFVARVYSTENPKAFFDFWKDEYELLTEKNNFGYRAIDVGPVTMGYRLNNSKAGFNITRGLIYPKGAFILHMIRMLMFDQKTHDDQFKATMKDFAQTYANRIATTEDFKAIVEKHMTPQMNLTKNGKMDWFFDEYVYGTALPNYKFDYSFGNGPDGKPAVNMKLKQSNVTDSFAMVVPVYAEFGNKIIRLGGMTMLGNNEVSVSIPIANLPEQPKRLLINHNYDVLSTQQ